MQGKGVRSALLTKRIARSDPPAFLKTHPLLQVVSAHIPLLTPGYFSFPLKIPPTARIRSVLVVMAAWLAATLFIFETQ